MYVILKIFKLNRCECQVDSANKHGSLLEVVQVLTDLDLVISKAYISSDGGWFMDGIILMHIHLISC
jgi:hypothetical protein